MPRIVGLAVSGALLVLAGIHVYWALRGTGAQAASAAIPTREGRPLFRPTPAVTLGVAGLLALGAAIVLGRLGLWGEGFPKVLFRIGSWGLASVFFARAVGDFRWVGFFKRQRGTRFALWDSRLYSPLCLALAAGAAFVGAMA